MLSVVHSAALQGIDAVPVEVEVNTGERGDPGAVLVGLPTTAVRESLDRVYSAIVNSGFKSNETKTTINLAPGHLKKEGPLYDLPIALGVLESSGQIQSFMLGESLCAGELSLSGQIRAVKGGLAMALLADRQDTRQLLLPPQTAEEAALAATRPVYRVENLDQAVAFLEGRRSLVPVSRDQAQVTMLKGAFTEVDFSEVKGQQALRRAVEVAVAGAHNLLIIGPPGSGKSMVAKRIPTIMPQLHREEMIDILRIYSCAGKTIGHDTIQLARPFRSPHHTISDVGLIGGGTIPGPGEISLAHHGVLFLDELPEFKRSALEVLRQPLEDRLVTISRSAGKITFPAAFMLVAAMNPTPDGHDMVNTKSTSTQIQRYRSKVSGPLLDRIDIHIEAPALKIEDLRSAQPGEASAAIRERVERAREIQLERFRGEPFSVNAHMQPRQLRNHCELNAQQGELLEQAMNRLRLSARAYDRIRKVARTIADLAGAERIETQHLMEAIQYRALDRETAI